MFVSLMPVAEQVTGLVHAAARVLMAGYTWVFQAVTFRPMAGPGVPAAGGNGGGDGKDIVSNATSFVGDIGKLVVACAMVYAGFVVLKALPKGIVAVASAAAVVGLGMWVIKDPAGLGQAVQNTWDLKF